MFFDINSDEAFFHSLQRSFKKLLSSNVKDTANILYLLMGLNHLREWICPGFDIMKQKPITPEQHFYVAIYGLPEFKIINALCNYSKHMKFMQYQTETIFGTKIDEYPEIDSVFDFDNGPPIGYLVDGQDLFKIIEVVLNYYNSEWYEKSSSNTRYSI